MIEVMQFIFQDFWHWLGTLILLIAICPRNKVHVGGVAAGNAPARDGAGEGIDETHAGA